MSALWHSTAAVRSATVVAHTSSAVWAEDHNGKLVAIHDPSVEPFPFSITTTKKLDGIEVGATIVLDGAVTELDSRCLVPPVEGVTPRVVLDAVGPHRFVQSVLFAEELSASLRAETADCRATIAGLIGRGGGLTPAADDVIVGALAAQSAFADSWLLSCELDRVVDSLDLDALTTKPSAAMLRSAIEGRYPPALCQLFGALGSRSKTGAAVARVRRIGHTTGPSMLCGIAAVADAASHGPLLHGSRPS